VSISTKRRDIPFSSFTAAVGRAAAEKRDVTATEADSKAESNLFIITPPEKALRATIFVRCCPRISINFDILTLVFFKYTTFNLICKGKIRYFYRFLIYCAVKFINIWNSFVQNIPF
jgi:hypothetical protein